LREHPVEAEDIPEIHGEQVECADRVHEQPSDQCVSACRFLGRGCHCLPPPVFAILAARRLGSNRQGWRRRSIAVDLDQPLLAVEQLAFQLAQRPSLVRRRMPSLRCSARSSSPSFRAPQTNITPTTTRGRARTSTRTISAASFIRTRVVSGPYPSPSSGGS